VPDVDDPARVLSRFLSAMTADSILVLSHASDNHDVPSWPRRCASAPPSTPAVSQPPIPATGPASIGCFGGPACSSRAWLMSCTLAHQAVRR
jgi:hypothetical protein